MNIDPKLELVVRGVRVCTLQELLEAYEDALRGMHAVMIAYEARGQSDPLYKARCRAFDEALVHKSKLLGKINRALGRS